MKTSSPFTFAVLTDSHIRLPEESSGSDDYPSNQLFNARNNFVIQQINQLAPDFVVHLGDMPHPIPALSTHEAAVQIAHDLYGQLDASLYVLPGNHDVGDKPNAWTPAPAVTEESHEVFERYWGASYQSFDHEDCHFVLINSPVLNSGLQGEREQRAWLERDLAANKKTGKRVFLFTHYPLFLHHPDEAEHYDNTGEPARTWLLALLEMYNVEAVFAGHVHNFFYNRYRNADLYVLPSVTFVRPEFSELFHVGPAAEYGRSDAEKLGFFLVNVDQEGHEVEFIRTHGLTEEHEEAVVVRPLSLSGAHAQKCKSPVGVSLRYAWATPVEMPYDNLDEFTRKRVRNDYLLLALWELGIRKLRVPLGDLAREDIRERMRVLQTLGHEFTVFSVGAPSSQAQAALVRYRDLIKTWEVIASWDQMPDAIRSIREVRQKVGVRTLLSKLDTMEDQERGGELHFSHFPSHGFRLAERDLLVTCFTDYGAVEAVDGFVFRLTADMKPWEGLQSAAQLAAELEVDTAVHVVLPRASEGVAYVQDHEISNRIAETVAAATGAKNVEVFLDTFVDHDRGYYPRNGLLDRRYNPRPAYYVFRQLQRALGGRRAPTSGDLSASPSTSSGLWLRPGVGLRCVSIETSPGFRAFALETLPHRCVLLLSETAGKPAELSLAIEPGYGDQNTTAKWMDLRTGKVREVRWRQSPADSGWTTLAVSSLGFDPALLFFELSS